MADQGIEAALTGVMQGIQGYLGKQNETNENIRQYQAEKDIDAAQNKPDGTAVSYMTPDLAEKILPGHGGAMLADWNKRNPGSPMTIYQAQDEFGKIQEMLKNAGNDPATEKDQQKLFQNFKSGVISSRGDPALTDLNKMQNAVGLGYRTLADVRAGKMTLTPTVWNDVIGQVWKARTGQAPTDQVMKDLDQKNIVEAMRHTMNYITGYEIPANVQPKVVMDNMLDFLKATGNDVDDRWEASMGPHLMKDPDMTGKYSIAADQLIAASRAKKFSEYTKNHQQSVLSVRQNEGKADTSGWSIRKK